MIQTLCFKLYNSKKNKCIHQKIDIAGEIYNHLIAFLKRHYKLLKKRPNKYQLQKHLTKLKKGHKNLSTKKKNSKRRKKARVVLAKIYKKLSNCRKDFFFKKAHELTDEYDYIFLENLCMKGMHKLWGRKVSDISFSKFVLILKHIASKKSKIVHQVDRFFPSSQICSNCDFRNTTLTIKERSWICPNCNREHDREQNAAMNILREGASSLGLDIVRLAHASKYCLTPESNRL